MTVEENIKKSETRIFKAVFPNTGIDVCVQCEIETELIPLTFESAQDEVVKTTSLKEVTIHPLLT